MFDEGVKSSNLKNLNLNVPQVQVLKRLDSNTSEEDAEAELSSLVNVSSDILIQDPEIHTYQEIVEIIEVVQVPKIATDIPAPSPMLQLHAPSIQLQFMHTMHLLCTMYLCRII